MPILSIGEPIPALRQSLEAVPVKEKDQQLFLLRDLEDIYLASRRLLRPAKTYSAKDVKRELGL